MKNLSRLAIMAILALMLGLTAACDVPEDGGTPGQPPSQPGGMPQ
jgi:hypothetical protein